MTTPETPDIAGCEVVTGDNKALIPALEDGSIQAMMTSVPYYYARDYMADVLTDWIGGDPNCPHKPRLVANIEKSLRSSTLQGGQLTNGHAQEGFGRFCLHCGAQRTDLQVGLEDSPVQYVDRLVSVFNLLKPKLTPTGTLWVNIDDKYAGSGGAGSGGAGGDYNKGGLRAGQPKVGRANYDRSAKNLLMLPSRFALAMQNSGWILRSEVIWYKRNVRPDAARDRCTKCHEKIFVFSDAEPQFEEIYMFSQKPQYKFNGTTPQQRSVWDIPTRKSGMPHFATMTIDVAYKMVELGSDAGDLIYDPFSGMGTTGVAARKKKRRYIGHELNPFYAEQSRLRLAGLLSQFDDEPAGPDAPTQLRMAI